jgi:hypothetical protein
MHEFKLARALLTILELLEFLTSPIMLVFGMWLSVDYLLMQVVQCDPWVAALLSLIVIVELINPPE